MNTNTVKFIVVIASITISIVAYTYLPDTIASHWNYLGEADGFSSKTVNLIAFPLLIVFLGALLNYIPRLDPKQSTILTFIKEYNRFIDILLIFFLTLQVQVIAWNLGYKVSMSVYMPIMLGILFYYIGDLIGKTKTNYTIGIRTPWTLSSEKVWDDTHKLGAKLFKLSLPVFIVSAFFQSLSFLMVIGYILLIVIVLFAYSYSEYKKEK
jgi:uncharacterized membrane protein